MMFFSRDVDRSVLSGVLIGAWNKPVLIIGGMTDFIRIGGVISILNEDNRFHFEIKPETAQRRGLKLSSRLLKLATIVED